MQTTTITLHTGFQIGDVDPRIFGGFLEHMGRCLYEGVYDPQSSHADEDGFRTDVLDALRRLNMTAMRYPGGNFVSGYHWMDGVGPRDQRPTVRELAWKSLEPNQFGTDEFIKLCRKMDWTPMITVNLGTGTPEEACNWVEYCNSPAGTKYADMRVANGNPEPHDVKLWCLGNEMDGPWQLGHVPADQYAIRAQQAAKMMRDADQSIELVACGSCTIDLPTYMEWDEEVLEYVGDLADYISLHRYVRNPDRADRSTFERLDRAYGASVSRYLTFDPEGATPDYLAITNSIDRQIEEMDAACRFVQAKRRNQKRAYLCFDEWNAVGKAQRSSDERTFPRHIAETIYNLEDALVVAGFFNSFIRHADVLKIANIAQIVNILPPVLTRGDDMLIQSIFYPFEMFSKRRDGISLSPVVEGPSYVGKMNGEVQTVDTSAIFGGKKLHIFLTNRSLDESATVEIEIADEDIAGLACAEILTGPDGKAVNSFEEPDIIKSRAFSDVTITQGNAVLELPPLSVVAATLGLA